MTVAPPTVMVSVTALAAARAALAPKTADRPAAHALVPSARVTVPRLLAADHVPVGSPGWPVISNRDARSVFASARSSGRTADDQRTLADRSRTLARRSGGSVEGARQSAWDPMSGRQCPSPCLPMSGTARIFQTG